MWFRKTLSVLGLLLVVSLNLTTAQDISSVGANLYFRAPDDSNLMQIFRLNTDNTVEKMTQASESIVAYDIAYDEALVFVGARLLVLPEITYTTGGPLDSTNVNLNDVAWSPDKSQVAIVAVSPTDTADAAEGVWILDVANSSWTLILNSVHTNDASKAIYQKVTWAASGDRLILDALFFESNATVRYNFFTQTTYAYNIADTGNINENGYSRGTLSRDGTDLVISDVPLSPTGDAFIIDVNDKNRIIPMTGEAARYVSHAFPIANGVAYFIRDFGNNITTSEVWQLSFDGARTALGSIPNADLADEVAWTPDGNALVYLNEFDDTTKLGRAHLFIRVEEAMQEATLPTEVSQIADPQWGPALSVSTPASVESLVFTEPLFDYQGADGVAFYTVRFQWNEVESSTGYRLTIDPAIEGQNAFDSTTVAAQLGRMTCGVTFNVTVAALGADGSAGEASPTSTVTTPPCDAEIVLPVITPSAPVAAGDGSTDTAAPTEQPDAAATEDTAAETPAAAGTPINPDDPNAPRDVTVAEATSLGTFADGRPAYGVDISWTSPGTTTFFYIQIDPPNNPNGFPSVVNSSDPTVATKIPDLECGTEYTLRVEAVDTDGITVLASSAPVSVTTPACP